VRCRSEEVGSVGEEEDVAWAWAWASVVAWASVAAWVSAVAWASVAATPIPSAASIPGSQGDGGPMVAATTPPHHPGAMARNPIMGLKHHTPGGKNLSRYTD